MLKNIAFQQNKKIFFLFSATILLCNTAVVGMFSGFIVLYKKNTNYESAQHLIEISKQIRSNVERTLLYNRTVTTLVADDIATHPQKDEQSLLEYMKQQTHLLNTTDLYVYNSAGLCMNQDGDIRSIDTSSETAYRTIRAGASYSITDFVSEYSVAVRSDQILRGHKIVAVSTACNLDTLIDDMNIESFDKKGAVYLTTKNGIKISQTKSSYARTVFNIVAIFTSGSFSDISGKNVTFEDAMSNTEQTVLIHKENKKVDYIIITPVDAGTESWLLFYIVPSNIVNKTMDGFSRLVIVLAVMSVISVCLITIIFFLVYVHRINQYNRELQSREEDLRHALVLADSANQAKTQFLSNMSHDIRTPMNAIINMTRFTIENYDDKKKAFEYLSVIQSSSDHLLKLINDVLDMSRIESGKLSFATEPFDLPQNMESICQIVKPLCNAKQQQFIYDASSFVHTKLIGDTMRLQRILINLLNNAMKFTPSGGTIQFSVKELSSLNPQTASYQFTVTDNGIGIAPDNIERIFEPFTRLEHNVDVQATEGSGLGLSITKRFVEAMGGTITVKSALHEGSTFTVELFFPLASEEIPSAKADAHSTKNFDGKRALLVEDNEINREIATMMLKEMGFAVETAADGDEAVEQYRKNAPYYYDIIFMDIQMARMNGYDASKLIRISQKEDAKTIPIIAMTANVFAEDKEKARKAEMSAHIGKPLNPDELQNITSAVLSDLNSGRNRK